MIIAAMTLTLQAYLLAKTGSMQICCYMGTFSHMPMHGGHECPAWTTCISRRLRLDSGRVYIDTILNGIVDLRHNCLTLSNKLRVALVGLFCDSGTEGVVVVQQQLQTGQYHRSQARALKLGLLLDQDLHIVWDRIADRVYDCIEDPACVRFVELWRKVGIDESLAVSEVDCADCSEDLAVMSAALFLLLALDDSLIPECPGSG